MGGFKALSQGTVARLCSSTRAVALLLACVGSCVCPVLRTLAPRHRCATTRLLGEYVGRVTCGFL